MSSFILEKAQVLLLYCLRTAYMGQRVPAIVAEIAINSGLPETLFHIAANN
jgi:hypothetical protein